MGGQDGTAGREGTRPGLKMQECLASSSPLSTPARGTAAGRFRRTREQSRGKSTVRFAPSPAVTISSCTVRVEPTRVCTLSPRWRISTSARPSPRSPLVRRVNEELPADINILEATVVPHRFHARHDAVARQYVYQIARRRTAFAKPYVWWIKEPLDVDRASPGRAQLHRPARFQIIRGRRCWWRT